MLPAHKIDNPIALCEFKLKGGNTNKFSGYASVFGGVDDYGDRIAPGAYTETLQNRDYSPLMLYQHYSSDVVGKWLDLQEDDKGLKVEGELTPGHSLANDVYASIKHQAISGLSIGYRVRGYEENDDDTRTLTKIDLMEVSIVAFPADHAARITEVKSLNRDIEHFKKISDFENYLRESCRFSRSAATAFMAQVKKICQSESDPLSDEQTKALSDAAIAKNTDEFLRVLDRYRINVN